MPKKPLNYSNFKPEQVQAARLLALKETGEKRTIKDIAEEVGVDQRSIYRWKEDPEFCEMVNDIADRYMDGFLSEAYAHLRKQVRNGSVKAMELYLKRMGKLIEKREVSSDVNIEVKGVDAKSNEELALETKQLEAELLTDGRDNT